MTALAQKIGTESQSQSRAKPNTTSPTKTQEAITLHLGPFPNPRGSKADLTAQKYDCEIMQSALMILQRPAWENTYWFSDGNEEGMDVLLHARQKIY